MLQQALEKSQALKRYRDAASAKLSLANLIFYSIVVIFGLTVVYQLLVLWGVGIDMAHEVSLREEFLNLPNIERYHFVEQAVGESRRIVGTGTMASAFRRWWEDNTAFKLFTLNTLLSQIVFGCITVGSALLAVYMYMMSKRDQHAIDSGLELHKEKLKLKMQQQQRSQSRLDTILAPASSEEKSLLLPSFASPSLPAPPVLVEAK